MEEKGVLPSPLRHNEKRLRRLFKELHVYPLSLIEHEGLQKHPKEKFSPG
jgi:hypothetical protein